MKTAIANLNWQLFINCPECGESLDLVDHDDGNEFATAIFNDNWSEINGVEAECPFCKKTFEIEKVEY